MLFQGLNVMEGSVFGENVRTIVMKRHCHNAREKFVDIMKVILAFCLCRLRVKWLKAGAFPRHIPVLLTIGSAPNFKQISRNI